MQSGSVNDCNAGEMQKLDKGAEVLHTLFGGRVATYPYSNPDVRLWIQLAAPA